MAVFMKFALVIMAFVCITEFVEMARIRRDDWESDYEEIFQHRIDNSEIGIRRRALVEEYKRIMAKLSPEEAERFLYEVVLNKKVKT